MIIRKKTYNAMKSEIEELNKNLEACGCGYDEAHEEIRRLKGENTELQTIIDNQMRRLALMPTFKCEDCKSQFLTPKYEKQKMNQVGNIRLVAVCPKCGSKKIEEVFNV